MTGWPVLLLTVLTLNGGRVNAQRPFPSRNHVFAAESGLYVSSSPRTPFWLRANQYGIVPNRSANATLRLDLRSDYRSAVAPDGKLSRRPFDWGYGVNVVANTLSTVPGGSRHLLLPEAYVKFRFYFLEVWGGRRREVVGLTDSTLTSGSYAWSGNALPLPKIQIGTPGFVNVPLTGGLLAVNGFFAHGWFDKPGFVTGSYLHQKTAYVRLGRPEWAIRLYGGINHNVQWAGYAPQLPYYLARNGQLPSRLKDYNWVITGKRGPSQLDSTLTSMEDNRIGNHLGTIDAAADIRLGAFSVFVYRQNLYDDGSLFWLTNLADGLNGIRLQNRRPANQKFQIREVLTELLYTRSQGGSVFTLEPGQDRLRGRDDYFNHSQYQDGWQYDGRVLGTPFLTPGSEVADGLPRGAIANNRVVVYHLAARGTFGPRAEWLLRASYSQNYGTYSNPFPAGTNQFSGSLNLSVPVRIPVLKTVQLNGSVAYDQGRLLGTTGGAYLGLRKTISAPANPVDASN